MTTPDDLRRLTVAIALTSTTPGSDQPGEYALLLASYWSALGVATDDLHGRDLSLMHDDERVTAIRDQAVRRFRYVQGDATALRPDEIEGFQAEVRFGLALLDELGDDVSDDVRRLREALRVSVAQTGAP